ncbi:YetF domain-containing protein [Clostridium beijerinckii]|uniref:YetF domain-containing protein n=1 Tax=Clostridium beijerinckii TaxID=1520 RepID=UPI00098C1084|nr:DUF421 domain-containing protein [Clostridium beijerinckii]MBA8934563.1 uncharacterized membrane protein YcaP (DUF421 family) [Clostridium beijerinckii]NRT35539.1 uncharacterized membrane protein YcaP (DUF421 family) [Clostridium beijerinckii]NRT45033.1 uncharacterized membrane protein YcaP (DUF421 family) [Clostridium beijerinckii]NRU38749.1 uncharacterized membrane protein YcaP (DUF421 family) [Clostridium beijerinckii]NRZ20971.1 uncharacterized membrane protein YcaP (DUF421 family) [Clos
MNLMNAYYSLIRTTIIFIVLMVLTRVLGKKQVSQLTFFNYVTGITVGSIAANMVSESNEPFMDDFVGLVWWCLLTILSGYIGLKSGVLRRIIDGEPTILIKKGKIIRKSLKACRVNMDDVSMMLRKQNVFSVTDIEYAILEPNGNLSIIKKQPQQQVTKSDMKISDTAPKYLPSEIIVDGKIIHKNLKEFNLTENWLNTQLKQQNVSSINDIFYAELQSDGTLYLEKM